MSISSFGCSDVMNIPNSDTRSWTCRTLLPDSGEKSRSLAKENIFKKRDILNSSKVVFDTKEDDLLIFPSKTIHGTEQGKSNSERISISADIVFLAKDSSTLEHLVPPVENWKKFSN